MRVEVDVLVSLIVQEVYESRGGRPGVPHSSGGV